jgi:glycine betaine/proline transport system ATP-binding protein
VQCGTPREIFTNPANDYVADFVAHMNPLGVLTARDVMIEGSSNGPEVSSETPVMEIIPAIDDAGLAVMEDGQVIGQITRSSLLHRLGG